MRALWVRRHFALDIYINMQKENKTYREAPDGYRPPYSSVNDSPWDRSKVDLGLLPRSVVVLPIHARDTKGSDSWSWAQVERAESVLESWQFDSIHDYVYAVASAPGAPNLTLYSFNQEGVDDLDGAAFRDFHVIFSVYHGEDVSWRIQPLEDDWIFIDFACRVWVEHGSHWSDCQKDGRYHAFICDGFRGMADAVAHIRSLPYGGKSKRIPFVKGS